MEHIETKIEKVLFYRKHLDSIFRDFTTFGGAPFFGLMMLFALLFWQIELFGKLLFGFVFTIVITIIIRRFYFKERPRHEEHHNTLEKLDASSFPSLHTARAVFLALIFGFMFPGLLMSLVLVVLTIFTAFSRIYLKRHDWWDLLGGAVLGVVAYGIVLLF
ncbi:MAG: phosphatase PAP2 family protein [Nanoarchaeota archaeon]